MSKCLDDVIEWSSSNRLLLNPDKFVFMWFSSTRRKHGIPDDPIRFGSSFLSPSATAKCLGVHFDSHFSFRTHVSKTASSCFSILRQIRSIRRSLTRTLLVQLVEALVLSRLDFCNSILSGVPANVLRHLQAVLNACARLIFYCSRFSSVTPLLRELKWLPIAQRISLRLSVLAHSCLLRRLPAYLSDDFTLASTVRRRADLRSSTSRSLYVPRVRHTTIGGRTFPVVAAKVWNSLPHSVQNSDPKSFKKDLKRFLLDNAFPPAV